MKVIVTSWFDGDNPYSIERVSTSVKDVMEYLKKSSSCFGDSIEFGKYFNSLKGGEFINGEEYLQNRLDSDSLGFCFARMYHSIFNEDERNYKYFMFQVRNLH
jgi:hypothetical protein